MKIKMQDHSVQSYLIWNTELARSLGVNSAVPAVLAEEPALKFNGRKENLQEFSLGVRTKGIISNKFQVKQTKIKIKTLDW